MGKLYNIIKFIRCTPQRREVFKGLIKDECLTGKLSPSPTFYAKTKLRGLGTSRTSLILFIALMVISDNDTRWNSTYLSMERALALEAKIRVYSEDHKDDLGEDFITLGDWDVIRELK